MRTIDEDRRIEWNAPLLVALLIVVPLAGEHGFQSVIVQMDAIAEENWSRREDA
jgi:hypothetical protein